jgi:Holliday junction resolvase RusA-like endonuclease
MVTVNIKPLSVNECWRGRRFKSPKYTKYEQSLLILLPPIDIPSPPYRIRYEFGFSSSASDIDNPIKPLQDILSKKYGFNDKLVFEMIVTRTKVKKGNEYIKFNIENLDCD